MTECQNNYKKHAGNFTQYQGSKDSRKPNEKFIGCWKYSHAEIFFQRWKNEGGSEVAYVFVFDMHNSTLSSVTAVKVRPLLSSSIKVRLPRLNSLYQRYTVALEKSSSMNAIWSLWYDSSGFQTTLEIVENHSPKIFPAQIHFLMRHGNLI